MKKFKDDNFRPKVGPPKARGQARVPFVSRVLKASAKGGHPIGHRFRSPSARPGAKLGRGQAAARLGRATANAYDELNRLSQITDPASGVTQFGYDANDNLTSVLDPVGLTTTYIYTGFGDLKTQVSPDTGTTTDTYDSGGNLATSKDARNAISTYAYDALNRPTSVAYKIGSTTDQTITFSYDAGTNGKGRLTGAADANHSMAWTYDAWGRVTGKGQTVGTVTKSVGYAYTNGDLVTLTTPSGQTLTYGYNTNHQVVSITLNGATTILNSATYEPLGPVNGWAWGNGTSVTRTYDTDGVISQIGAAGLKTLSYDNALRITGISDTSTGASNWTYGYDLLDRVTSGAGGSTTRGWSYDANGNRLTETGTAACTYTISGTSNRVSSITGALPRTYTYDAAGHVLTYSTVTATYNDRGRAKSVKKGSVTESLLYNALGQMMTTSGGAAGSVLYMYDEAGHLLGEYSSSGTLVQETVWLGDIPVATLRPSGSTVAVYYVEADHLNTPRQVTRPSDNVQMWTWFSDPFGTTTANSNPAGAGTFIYNLRFPGQIYDSQAGLQQNWNRDYDPAIGRYIESDPIGLIGGINTYAYTASSPTNLYDPKGLTNYWPAGTNAGLSGRVVCNSKHGLTIDISFLRAIERKCIGDCARLHELVHVMDFRRIDPQVCQGVGTGMVPSFDTTAQNNASENRAYDASTECLRRKLAGMSDCDSCKATVQLFLNDAPRARASSMR